VAILYLIADTTMPETKKGSLKETKLEENGSELQKQVSDLLKEDLFSLTLIMNS